MSENLNDINKILKKEIGDNPYAKMLGLEMLECRPGYGKGRIPYSGGVTNPYGTIHGGALYSLADIVSGLAACAYGQKCVTLDGSLNFLNPAMKTEYVYCEAREQRRGKDITVLYVEIRNDEGELLDTGTFTFFIIKDNMM